MRLHLHGGFRERGRISLGVESRGQRLLLDTGIDTSASGPSRYPRLGPTDLAATRAIIITHAHEDHVGALGWCLSLGWRGPVFMTAEARRGAPSIWHGYAEPAHRALAEAAPVDTLPAHGTLALGDFAITTGRSGHIVGGVWVHVSDGKRSVLHCGDIVPASAVFTFDDPPAATALVLDASYGDDRISARERADQIIAWVAAHRACVLPAPLGGRSLELVSLIPPPVAIHASMRPALTAQASAQSWIRDGVREVISERLARAHDWAESSPLPECPLIVHDGMGLMGPSQQALAMAHREGRAVLLTGHVPAGSPAAEMLDARAADWTRLPTHPTLPETLDLVRRVGPRLVLGHSADPAIIESLAPHILALNSDAVTGDCLEV